jgi:hypothetical protein
VNGILYLVGTLTSQPYLVSEGQEYVAYLENLLGQCGKLVAEGRLPDADGVADVLAIAEVVLRRVRLDTASAAARGEQRITTTMTMTEGELKRLLTIGESMLNLLEILEIRQALEFNRTDAVARVGEAIYGGVYSD